MTVAEIFTSISARLIEGMMVHEQMANYYDFLGLKGYKRCHEYHYICETLTHRSINRYYINHFNQLIPDIPIAAPKNIPESWYRNTRQDVDNSTKKNAVKAGLENWVAWEKGTKKLYEQMYKELMALDEVAAAFKVKELVCDVDNELKHAERYWLNKKAIDYNLSDIIAEQKPLHCKYERKMKKLGVEIC